MTDQLPYTVVRAFPCFDVRRYPALVLVQVRIASVAPRAGLVGAGALHRYLGGDNATGAVFDVPAPLLYEVGESGPLVSLVLPTDTDPVVVPAPLDERVLIRARPAHEVAALGFTGRFSTPRLLAHGRELLAEVRSCRLEPVGSVSYARFDQGHRPGFLCHNEALVRVIST